MFLSLSVHVCSGWNVYVCLYANHPSFYNQFDSTFAEFDAAVRERIVTAALV